MDVTDSLTLTAALGARLDTWAAPETVVIEIIDGTQLINAHLTIDQARQHIRHVETQIAAALRLSGLNLQLVNGGHR